MFRYTTITKSLQLITSAVMQQPRCGLAVAASQEIKKVGFIGLGKMGAAMSKNLVNKGYEVIVYDMSSEAIKMAEKSGSRGAVSKGDLAQDSDCIITMLPEGKDVLGTYTGQDGIIDKVKPGTLVIDSSTVDPNVPKELEPLFSKRGSMFIDAPVTGGQIGAINGTLTFIVGGEAKVMERAKPVLLSMGKNVVHCGQIGSGQVAKICNNMMLGISMTGLSEALNLGARLGVDPKIISYVINNGTGRCWSSEINNPVPGAVENSPSGRDYQAGFAAQMIFKDLRLARDVAARSGSPISLGLKTVDVYDSIVKEGLGPKDFSVVYKFFQSQKS